MNRKKWQGTACFLLASLMVSSVFAAPVRQEAPTPKVVTSPATTTTPPAAKVSEPTTMPKATTSPEAVQSPKPSACPNTKEMPQKQQQKPFTLDHFKMIVNALKKVGVEESQIVVYIKEGKKLEDILKAEKINTKKFKKYLMKEYFAVVDEAVKNGQITAEQSKQLKAAIKETIANWLPKK